jgi:LEA14-like dessication related protein
MVVLRVLKYLVVALVALAALVAVGFLLGVFGIPELTSIDNEFGDVNESTTEIRTNVSVDNPNPIGLSLGGLRIDYTIGMNDVAMANGTKQGLSIGTGNSTLGFRTYLDNGKIPNWWYRHVDRGERTSVVVDADVSHSAFGSTSFQQTETIETDILSAIDSTETREINADRPLVDDPILYLNETTGSFGDDVTPQRTPIGLDFTVYNPKVYPYAITEIGYTIEMNNVTVGNGSSGGDQVLAPRETSTIEANTAIRNQRLDRWWVTHLQNDEVTDLYIDFYVVVDPELPGAEPVRIDTEAFDYRTTIETDMLGSSDSGGNGSAGNASAAVAPAT